MEHVLPGCVDPNYNPCLPAPALPPPTPAPFISMHVKRSTGLLRTEAVGPLNQSDFMGKLPLGQGMCLC